MDPCSVCEDSIYHEQDGCYFCSTCGTKYEGAQDMETEVDYSNRNISFTKISGPKKSVSEPLHVPHENKGRWWNKYDLYQIALQHQVEALISMGAQPKLKDLVFRLWMKYLSLVGIAFCDDKRDLKKSDKPSNPKKAPGKDGKKTSKKISSSKNSKMHNITNHDAKKGMDSTEIFDVADNTGDNHDVNLENSDDQGDDNVDEKETFQDDCEKHVHVKKRLQYDCTLAFCYLGLAYTNPLVQISDLLRWVRENRVPFLNTKDFLPDSVKMTKYESLVIFEFSKIVNYGRLATHIHKIANYLQLQNFPEIDLTLLIKKYILLLNLPVEMCSLMSKLVSSQRICAFQKVFNYLYLPGIDKVALSYVIVLLKLLFGLDDNTEIELSSCSRKLMDLTNHKHALFVFDDWLKFMKDSQGTVSSRITTYSTADISMDDNGSVKSKPESSRCSQTTFAPLFSLSQLWAESQTGNQSTGSNNQETSNTGSDPGARRREEEHFRNSSVQYVLHPNTFLRTLDNLNLNGATLDSILTSSGDENSMEIVVDGEARKETVEIQETMSVKAEGDELFDEDRSIGEIHTLGTMDESYKHGIHSSISENLYKKNRAVSDSSETIDELNRNGIGGVDRVVIETDNVYSVSCKRQKLTSDNMVPELTKKMMSPLQTFLLSNMSVTNITDREQYEDVLHRLQYARDVLHMNYQLISDLTSLSFDDVLDICSHLIHIPSRDLLPFVVKTEMVVIKENT